MEGGERMEVGVERWGEAEGGCALDGEGYGRRAPGLR